MINYDENKTTGSQNKQHHCLFSHGSKTNDDDVSSIDRFLPQPQSPRTTAHNENNDDDFDKGSPTSVIGGITKRSKSTIMEGNNRGRKLHPLKKRDEKFEEESLTLSTTSLSSSLSSPCSDETAELADIECFMPRTKIMRLSVAPTLFDRPSDPIARQLMEQAKLVKEGQENDIETEIMLMDEPQLPMFVKFRPTAQL